MLSIRLRLVTAGLLSVVLCSAAAAQGPEARPRSQAQPSLTWGDFDGDGAADAAFIDASGQLKLLRNDARSFRDVTVEAALQDLSDAVFTRWGDYDADGDQDLLVGTARGARLFQNAAGRFEDVTSFAGLEPRGAALDGHWIDFDVDGRLDLHLIDGAESRIYRGLEAGLFELVLSESGAALAAPEGEAVWPAALPARADGPVDEEATASRSPAADMNAARAGSGFSSERRSLAAPGSSPSAGSGGGGGPQLLSFCAPSIVDQSGGCLMADSNPTLGMLYPMSTELNVAPGGYVGIGTTAPSRKLHVSGDSLIEGDVDVGGALAVTSSLGLLLPGWGLTGVAGKLQFRETNGDTRMVIAPGGNVGVGTTSPSRKLHVSGNTLMDGDVEVNGPLTLTSKFGMFLPGWDVSGFAGQIQFNETNIGTRLAIAPGGNVGIGTDTPEYRLHAQGANGGSFRFYDFPAGEGAQLVAGLNTENGAGPMLRFEGAGPGFIDIGQNSAGSFVVEGSDATHLTVLDAGNVGLRTDTPDARLTLGNIGGVDGAKLLGFSESGPNSGFWFESGFAGSNEANYLAMAADDSPGKIMSWRAGGQVGINTTTPLAELHTRRELGDSDDPAALFQVHNCGVPCGQPAWTEAARLWNDNPNGRVGLGFVVHDSATLSTVPDVYLGTGDNVESNDFRVATRVGSSLIDRLTVDGASGLVSIKQTLEIRGGADIVERFQADEAVEAGTVVVIDPANPGGLMRSTVAYDTKVAGVVSGAGGINPGLCLSQDGEIDGDTLVAMNGRVYVKATAANGAIEPGDRLTTSDLAGHAMKATDSALSDGAVLGKAMTGLAAGEGLVLVLVNLQ